jgi:hypothetical protein
LLVTVYLDAILHVANLAQYQYPMTSCWNQLSRGVCLVKKDFSFLKGLG